MRLLPSVTVMVSASPMEITFAAMEGDPIAKVVASIPIRNLRFGSACVFTGGSFLYFARTKRPAHILDGYIIFLNLLPIVSVRWSALCKYCGKC